MFPDSAFAEHKIGPMPPPLPPPNVSLLADSSHGECGAGVNLLEWPISKVNTSMESPAAHAQSARQNYESGVPILLSHTS